MILLYELKATSYSQPGKKYKFVYTIFFVLLCHWYSSIDKSKIPLGSYTFFFKWHSSYKDIFAQIYLHIICFLFFFFKKINTCSLSNELKNIAKAIYFSLLKVHITIRPCNGGVKMVGGVSMVLLVMHIVIDHKANNVI